MVNQGIKLEKLTQKIITDEKSVLNFLKKYSDKAFTIEMLKKEGFSSNIRKVLNRLTDDGKVNKTNVKFEGGERWVTAYFNSHRAIEFIVKKTEAGRLIESLKINDNDITVDVYTSSVDNSVNLKLDCNEFQDVVVYYSESDPTNLEKRVLRSIRYSEIKDLLKDSDVNIEYIYDDESKIKNEFFEVYTKKGARTKISRTRAILTGTEIQMGFRDLNFDFHINLEKRIISISGSQWDEKKESDEKILLDSVSLGDWDEKKNVYDYTVKDVDKVLLYY